MSKNPGKGPKKQGTEVSRDEPVDEVDNADKREPFYRRWLQWWKSGKDDTDSGASIQRWWIVIVFLSLISIFGIRAAIYIITVQDDNRHMFEVTIETGHVEDQNVEHRGTAYLRLHDKKGTISEAIDLGWSFFPGSSREVNAKVTAKLEEVNYVEIWLERKTDDCDLYWFVETIKVTEVSKLNEDDHNENEYDNTYPVHRWITMKHQIIQLHDSTLPNEEKHVQRRVEGILDEQDKFAFQHLAAECIPVMQTLKDSSVLFAKEYYKSIFLSRGIRDKVKEKLLPWFTGKWRYLADTSNIYNVPILNFKKPRSVDFYHTVLNSKEQRKWKELDKVFGALRLNGINPLVIHRCTEKPKYLNVTDDMLKPHMEGLTIKEAIEKKRLYVVDYSTILHNISCSNGMIAAPIALFFVNEDQDLMPVAIQLFKKPAADNPVFLPCYGDCKYTWLLAKMWFNNADASYHQSVAHLGFTHLIMETIYVALRHTVSASHPLYRLMAPHFLYLLNVNNIAWDLLLNNGGWVDRSMTIGIKGMMEIIRRRYTGMEGYHAWRLDVEGNLPKDLEERGVTGNFPPKYYFRDDALQVHGAIRKYVERVTTKRYQETLLEDDHEIQAWIEMMAKPADPIDPDGGGCGIKFRNEDLQSGKFTNLDQVIDTVTSVIYISSVLHAAVNFPQYEQYAYPLHYPAILNGDPPRISCSCSESQSSEKFVTETEDDVMQAIPAKSTTLGTMTITDILSQKHTFSLGHYETKWQYDDVGEQALEQFQNDLKLIGTNITNRNTSLKKPTPVLGVYDGLHPANIPNAISI